MAYKVLLMNGPLEGCHGWLELRPLDGEVHLFSDQTIDKRSVAYPYQFSELKRCFLFVGQIEPNGEYLG